MNPRPTVEIDSRSGFCNGVVSAIRKAEQQLDAAGSLYCLGDIVHNSDEVERLRSKGLVTISHDDLNVISGSKVLLRAHGEPPSTYALARSRDIELIDATCPVVLMLQRRIKDTFVNSPSTQIVIYGKNGHAEVNGLVGQTDGRAIVVENVDQLHLVDFTRDIALYSQTTMPLKGFNEMIARISALKSPESRFTYHDTICRQVANRVDHLREFASRHDVVLFVSGAKSSNGKVLYGECRQVNGSTRLISDIGEITAAMLAGARSIGICGATSTPRWLMEQARDRVNELITESAAHD